MSTIDVEDLNLDEIAQEMRAAGDYTYSPRNRIEFSGNPDMDGGNTDLSISRGHGRAVSRRQASQVAAGEDHRPWCVCMCVVFVCMCVCLCLFVLVCLITACYMCMYVLVYVNQVAAGEYHRPW